MLDLTFGEQVKIILRRKGMTIKELAEKMEKHTGKKMSRQNLTQRLGRDNFQEQDMRQIAEILGCRFQLSIMEDSGSAEKNFNEEVQQNIEIDNVNEFETEVTVGEFIDNFEGAEVAMEEVSAAEEFVAEEPAVEEAAEEELAISAEETYEEPVEELYVEVPEEEEAEETYEEVYVEAPAGDEYVEEAYAEPVYEESYEQEAETSVEEALKELEILEQEDKAYKLEREQKKKRGWMDRFGFNRKKEAEQSVKAEPVKEAVQEQTAEEVYEEPVYEEPVYGEPAYEEAYEEPVYEEPAYEEPAYEEPVYEEPVGDVNPYTGREYETNSVRMHPKRIGYVQVYDRGEHKWTDMTEWAFLGYQEQKKMLLGKDYEPPIYLD